MKILKFGGTSVGSPEAIKKTIQIIINEKKQKKEFSVVVSAFAGATNSLLDMSSLAAKKDKKYLNLLEEFSERHFIVAGKLVKVEKLEGVLERIQDFIQELRDLFRGVYLVQHTSPRTEDTIMSYGEKLAAYIISQALKMHIPDTEFIDSSPLIKTDDNFGAALVDYKKTFKNIKALYAKKSGLKIITGFVGSTDEGVTTTLGRGGSDYTASLIAAALQASRLELWTDVDGVMTADPRMVPEAFPVSDMTYEEAMELAHFGAKVIFPPALFPAFEKKIPVYILNTFAPQNRGTKISGIKGGNGAFIRGISSIKTAALLLLQGGGMVGVVGTASRLFSTLSKNDINIILITQGSSEHSICIAVKPEEGSRAKKLIETEFALEINAGLIQPVGVVKPVAIMAAVGENMRNTPGISGRLFGALAKNGINVIAIAQGSSERNISFVVNTNDAAKTLNVLHEAFFLSNKRSLNIFLVGTGKIGTALFSQISQNYQTLMDELDLKICFAGIANSKKMLFNKDGIDQQNWKKLLVKGGLKMEMTKFFKRMQTMNLPQSVFVDCTANEMVASYYEKILKKSISIVTPNKRACSGSLDSFRNLKAEAKKRGIQFIFETNVGAGLPVISTLDDLLKSGDRILKIEAVLSGTLSYIFNNFDGSCSFSEIVREARAKGFTEPDPRDDLNGMDFARKLLILGRQCGAPLELEEIKIESLMSEDCLQAKNIDDFFVSLKKMDREFARKHAKARKKGRKLCYLGLYENGNACVNLKEIENEHPFYYLSGSDNIISFTTERYRENPLVIKGPGAGVEVTAAGVFSDIIRLAHYF
ncbi:bifunctional aspartate kinase/homoserine dehydrogenase I [Candidatus Riflebacteria bacterium]